MHQASVKKIILWTLAFALASVLVSFSNFESSSNDSKYYSTLVTRYYSQSWPEILTAKWGENYWGFAPDTYMRDQLPGQIVMGSALAKIGIPAKHSLHIIEMGFLLGAFLLCLKIAQFFGNRSADLIVCGMILLPLTFSYTIRANHEAGLFFFSVLALYSGLQLSHSKWWSLAVVLSCLALMWIKGPFVVFGFLLFSWGFFLNHKRKYFSWLFTFFISAILVSGSGFLYENLFRTWTSEPFFSVFWNIQIEQRALNQASHPFLIQKILNFKYYFLKYLAYALPWTAIGLMALIKGERKKIIEFLKSPLSICFLGAGLIYIGAFSMSDRIAGRYTFPGYYFFAVWILLLCQAGFDVFQKLTARLSGLKAHALAALLWIAVVISHLL